MNKRMSARVRSCPQLYCPVLFFPVLLMFAVEMSRGTRRLRNYLNAPADVQEAFDRKIRREVQREAEDALVLSNLRDDDLNDPEFAPLAQEVQRRQENDRLIEDALGLHSHPKIKASWDDSWDRRSRPLPAHITRKPYDSATDPLLALDLRDIWEQLTGEEVPRWGRVTCPTADHDDRHPDCAVYEGGWKCFGCGSYGTVINLAGHLYGMEPRSSDFFRIRARLMADLGMEEAA